MIDITAITNLISAFRSETVKDSISPERMGGILQQMADLLGESISQSEYIMLKTYYENSNKLPAPLATIEQGDESADNLKVNLAWVNLLDGVQTKLTNQVLFKLATTS